MPGLEQSDSFGAMAFMFSSNGNRISECSTFRSQVVHVISPIALFLDLDPPVLADEPSYLTSDRTLDSASRSYVVLLLCHSMIDSATHLLKHDQKELINRSGVV